MRELFNLRHASLRNVIERCFGVLKKRFQILKLGPEYTYSVQVKLVPALAALHNFIRVEAGEDWVFAEFNLEEENMTTEPGNYIEEQEE